MTARDQATNPGVSLEPQEDKQYPATSGHSRGTHLIGRGWRRRCRGATRRHKARAVGPLFRLTPVQLDLLQRILQGLVPLLHYGHQLSSLCAENDKGQEISKLPQAKVYVY